MQEILHWVIRGLGVLAVGLGGYLAGYLKKKGETRAIHENLERLVEELSATTKATKEIEARISHETWDRQKRWELKREVLFDATKKTFAVQNLFAKLPLLIGRTREDVAKLEAAVDKFEQAVATVEIVCDETATVAFLRLRSRVGMLFVKVQQEQLTSKHAMNHIVEAMVLHKQWHTVRAAIRKELEINEIELTSLSTESSEAPSPD
jgi:hypothetical protein